MKTKPDRVIFRICPAGEVVALFPDLPWKDCSPYVISYAHIGQHSAANYNGLIVSTKPATPEQYAPLKSELESQGYRLTVRKRR